MQLGRRLWWVSLLLPTLGNVGVALQAHADSQALVMAQANLISHSDIRPLLEYCSWVGENVGVGASLGAIQLAWSLSPSHAEILNHPRSHMATGVAEGGMAVYAAELYCQAHQASTTTARVSLPTTSRAPPSGVIRTRIRQPYPPPICWQSDHQSRHRYCAN